MFRLVIHAAAGSSDRLAGVMLILTPSFAKLNNIGYEGPLSVEWEDTAMDREFGAKESCEVVRATQFPASGVVFDDAFAKENQHG